MCLHPLIACYDLCPHYSPVPQAGPGFLPALKCQAVVDAFRYYHSQLDRLPEVYPPPCPSTCPPVWGDLECRGNVIVVKAPGKCVSCSRVDWLVGLAVGLRDYISQVDYVLTDVVCQIMGDYANHDGDDDDDSSALELLGEMKSALVEFGHLFGDASLRNIWETILDGTAASCGVDPSVDWFFIALMQSCELALSSFEANMLDIFLRRNEADYRDDDSFQEKGDADEASGNSSSITLSKQPHRPEHSSSHDARSLQHHPTGKDDAVVVETGNPLDTRQGHSQPNISECTDTYQSQPEKRSSASQVMNRDASQKHRSSSVPVRSGNQTGTQTHSVLTSQRSLSMTDSRPQHDSSPPQSSSEGAKNSRKRLQAFGRIPRPRYLTDGVFQTSQQQPLLHTENFSGNITAGSGGDFEERNSSFADGEIHYMQNFPTFPSPSTYGRRPQYFHVPLLIKQPDALFRSSTTTATRTGALYSYVYPYTYTHNFTDHHTGRERPWFPMPRPPHGLDMEAVRRNAERIAWPLMHWLRLNDVRPDLCGATRAIASRYGGLVVGGGGGGGSGDDYGDDHTASTRRERRRRLPIREGGGRRRRGQQQHHHHHHHYSRRKIS